MIRKSATRFSEKIMLDQKTQLDLEKLEPVSCLRSRTSWLSFRLMLRQAKAGPKRSCSTKNLERRSIQFEAITL
jgi:hypothetical protein